MEVAKIQFFKIGGKNREVRRVGLNENKGVGDLKGDEKIEKEKDTAD